MTDNEVMHRRQLVDEVARRSGPWGLTRRQVREALHGILDVITDEMAEGNAVTIAGFGRFEAKGHKGRRVSALPPAPPGDPRRGDRTRLAKLPDDGIMPPNLT